MPINIPIPQDVTHRGLVQLLREILRRAVDGTQNIGVTSRITGSGVVGTSGRATTAYGYTMKSTAGGNGVVTFYDGTSTSGTERWTGTGNAGDSAILNFSAIGKYFASGLYIQLDANVEYIDVDYRQ